MHLCVNYSLIFPKNSRKSCNYICVLRFRSPFSKWGKHLFLSITVGNYHIYTIFTLTFPRFYLATWETTPWSRRKSMPLQKPTTAFREVSLRVLLKLLRFYDVTTANVSLNVCIFSFKSHSGLPSQHECLHIWDSCSSSKGSWNSHETL